MAFINPSELLATAFEPKVANRFIMDINGILGFMVKTAATPNFSSDEVVLDHINTYRKIKGKQRWGDMTITLYDPITPSGASASWADWANSEMPNPASLPFFVV